MLNEQEILFFERQKLGLLKILIDRGAGYCGIKFQHEYPFYLEIKNINHIKAKSPKNNREFFEVIVSKTQ